MRLSRTDLMTLRLQMERGSCLVLSTSGGKGSDTRPRGGALSVSKKHLKTGIVLVLLECYILEMLADYHIIKLLMKFKIYNSFGMNSVKFELRNCWWESKRVQPFLESIGQYILKVLKHFRGRWKLLLGFWAPPTLPSSHELISFAPVGSVSSHPLSACDAHLSACLQNLLFTLFFFSLFLRSLNLRANNKASLRPPTPFS